MMKRLISMLLALMMLLAMATAEDAADDDAWKGEIVGYAIERARQMDAEARSPEYAERWETLNGTISDEIKAALADVDHTMPQKVFVSETGQSSAWVRMESLLFIAAKNSSMTAEEMHVVEHLQIGRAHV